MAQGTAAVRAQETPDPQHELLEAIVANVPVMLCLFDAEMRALQTNRECERILGWTTAEATGGDLLSMMYPDPEYRREVAACMQAPPPGWREFRTVARNGEAVPCEWTHLRLADGRLLGIGRDLRQRRAWEAALRASAEVEAILDALPVSTYVARDASEMRQFPRSGGLGVSEPRGHSGCAFRLMRDGREIPPGRTPVQRAAETGEAVRDYECDLVFDDGSRRNLLGNAVPVPSENGGPRRAVAVFLDITDRKRAEAQARESHKLETLGLLAGGIAHDFNNVLTAIVGNASMLLNEVPAPAATRLRRILQSAGHATSLVRQLLAYSGQREAAAVDVDIAQAVSDLRGLMELSVPKSVRLSLELEQRVGPVEMDPSQFEQILMNLVINAGEAIGEGQSGRIRVGVGPENVAQPFLDATGSEIQPGRYARLDVQDTGSGMPAETLRRIFDPFFSTKRAGRGLGLAAVARIIRSRQGGVTVESAAGRGTTFRVFLPLAGRGVEFAGEPADRSRGSVLIIDDDHCVRDFIGEVARGAGRRVLTACDGEEALAWCDRETIDAVVLDVVMPVMGANVLLPEIKRRQPAAHILLTSGYSEQDARRLCAPYPEIAFVQKPYTAEQIAAAIEGLLNGVR